MLGERLLKAIFLVFLSVEVLDRLEVQQRVSGLLVVILIRLSLPLEAFSAALRHDVCDDNVENDGAHL